MHQTMKILPKAAYCGCVLFALQSTALWAMPPDIQSPYTSDAPETPYVDDTQAGRYQYPARPDYYQPHYGYPGYRAPGYPPHHRVAPPGYGYRYDRGYGYGPFPYPRQPYYSQGEYPPNYESAEKGTVPTGTAATVTTVTESASPADPSSRDIPSATAATHPHPPLLPATTGRATTTDPSLTQPAPAAGAKGSESLYDKAKGKVKDVFKSDESAATTETAPTLATPAATVTTPAPTTDLSTTQPAPAAGAKGSQSLYDKAKGKVKDVFKGDESAATTKTAPTPAVPAATVTTPAPTTDLSTTQPAPAAGAKGSESLYDKAKGKVKDVFKGDESAATTKTAPTPAVPAATVTTPAPTTDLSTTQPAPAAGATGSKSIYDRASDKVKEIFKSDEAAVPVTAPPSEILAVPAAAEPRP